MEAGSQEAPPVADEHAAPRWRVAAGVEHAEAAHVPSVGANVTERASDGAMLVAPMTCATPAPATDRRARAGVSAPSRGGDARGRSTSEPSTRAFATT